MKLVFRTSVRHRERMSELDLPQRACNTEWVGIVKVVLDSPIGGLGSPAGNLKASKRKFCC